MSEGDIDAMNTCKDCKYWQSKYDYEGEPIGECRFNPPIKPTPDNARWEFPMTMGKDWCGMFRPNNPERTLGEVPGAAA